MQTGHPPSLRTRIADGPARVPGATDSGCEPDVQAMVAFLRRHIHALMSDSFEPVPACPRCGSGLVRGLMMVQFRTGLLPNFLCHSCGRAFNRLTGTPLARSLFRHQLDPFIALLGEPISILEAARRLSSKGESVARYVRTFRRWLLVLDPSGHYERAVQLGGQVTAVRNAPLSFPEDGAREDLPLTAMLTADFDDIHSPSTEAPPCPLCGSNAIRRKGVDKGLPLFYCKDCRRKFNRRTGTAFVRQKDGAKQREIIRYLVSAGGVIEPIQGRCNRAT